MTDQPVNRKKKNNQPVAYVLDPDQFGNPRFEIIWEKTVNGVTEEKVFRYVDGLKFFNNIKSLKIPRSRVIDKRKGRKSQVSKSHDATKEHKYRKRNNITALQYLAGYNEKKIEKFISAHKGKCEKQGSYYKVYYVSKGVKNSGGTKDKAYDTLYDMDYVISQNEGDVYACSQEAFEESYQFVAKVPPKNTSSPIEEQPAEPKVEEDKRNKLEKGDNQKNDNTKDEKQSDNVKDKLKRKLKFPEGENFYKKVIPVKAIMFSKKIKNHEEVEDFIKFNEGRFAKYKDTYRVYSFGGGHDYLEDGDYVVCRKDGDVYACPGFVFELTYGPVLPITSKQIPQDDIDDVLFES